MTFSGSVPSIVSVSPQINNNLSLPCRDGGIAVPHVSVPVCIRRRRVKKSQPEANIRHAAIG
jgi:hypothetical protein